MDLRITQQAMTSQAIASLSSETSTLNSLQQQADTGLKINEPSDDPVDAVTVLANNVQNLQLQAYQTNMSAATATLNESSSSLQSASSILDQAKQIAIEGASATNDATSNQALAAQIQTLVQQMLAAANARDAGGYLFGGTANQAAPFTTDANGTVVYTGSGQAAQAPVSPQQSVATYLPGDQVFQQQDRGPTLYTGATGAAAGTGTDNATGQGALLVTHTTTIYQAGSGVQAGTGSAAGDTIIGPAGSHTLTVVDTSGTGVGGTVSLDGGTPVAFTSSDTNLQVADSQGNVVFLNTTAITPGYNGTVNITANGTLSVDNGTTQTPINFSANQVVTNGATGAVTNVNSTNIRSTGTDSLSYQGTYDAFQILQAIGSDLTNTTLTDAQRTTSLSNLNGELARVQTGILNAAGAQGASLTSLASLQKQNQNVQLDLQQLTANLQDADITQVVVNLQAQQNLLQMSLSATSRINTLNLAQFL